MIILPSYKKYPPDYPVVSKIGFSGTVDTGVSRSSEQGFPTQERYAGSNPTNVSLQFRMTLTQFRDWSSWINHNAVTKWVDIMLPSPNGLTAAGLPSPMSEQTVRFGDYTMTPLGANFLQVNTTVQLMPRGIGEGLPGGSAGNNVVIISPSSKWIIGGTPPAPSADWVISGRPGTPSTPDVYIGGTPSTV